VSDRLVPLGEIVSTHGIDGWLKLKTYNPLTTALSAKQSIFLEKSGACAPHVLEETRSHRGMLLLRIAGIDGINKAEPWVGALLSVSEEQLQPLQPGEYYYYQAIGLDVVDTQGRWLGVVTRLWSKPGGDLYVVTGERKEYLIPAVKEIVEKIDFASGKMIINPPPGLLDL
jgi:16S rRNA processing protein RimM